MEPLRPQLLVVLKKTASSTSLASKEDTTDSARFSRKFGKHIQKRQLEIPEYAASFVDYKALKKVLYLPMFLLDQHQLMSCSSLRSSALHR
jgi:CDK inhibitor PHO81